MSVFRIKNPMDNYNINLDDIQGGAFPKLHGQRGYFRDFQMYQNQFQNTVLSSPVPPKFMGSTWTVQDYILDGNFRYVEKVGDRWDIFGFAGSCCGTRILTCKEDDLPELMERRITMLKLLKVGESEDGLGVRVGPGRFIVWMGE